MTCTGRKTRNKSKTDEYMWWMHVGMEWGREDRDDSVWWTCQGEKQKRFTAKPLQDNRDPGTNLHKNMSNSANSTVGQYFQKEKRWCKVIKRAPTPPQWPTLKAYVKLNSGPRKGKPCCPDRTQHEWKNHPHICFISPGDATIVQPLLSSHDDVESAAKVVWLHIHDLPQHVWRLGIKQIFTSLHLNSGCCAVQCSSDLLKRVLEQSLSGYWNLYMAGQSVGLDGDKK